MKRSHRRRLKILLCFLSACVVILALRWTATHGLERPGDRYLATRYKVEELRQKLSNSPDHFVPTSPKSKDTPFLIAHREVAELLTVRAFLIGAIYPPESGSSHEPGVRPYDIIFGGHTRQELGLDYSDHYRRVMCIPVPDAPDLCSSASGSCQFVPDQTWDPYHVKYPDIWYADIPAFDPRNQDLGCMIAFAETGGYALLMKAISLTPTGRIAIDLHIFAKIIHDACWMWASFPCENGQSHYYTAEYGWQESVPLEDITHKFLVALEAEEAALLPLTDQANTSLVSTQQPVAQVDQSIATNVAFSPDLLKKLNRGDVVAGYAVTSPFGWRVLDGVDDFHAGVDIGMDEGTPILAPLPGTVTCHDDGKWGVYALLIFDDLPERSFMVHHTSKCFEGHVNIQDKLAESGTAGTGPHLHLAAQKWENEQWLPYDYPAAWAWGFLKGVLKKDFAV